MKPAATQPSELECSLDRDLIVFDGDRDLRAQLLRDRDFHEAYKTWDAMPDGPSMRRNMLLTSVRLTERLAPEVWACVEHCVKTLGVNRRIELYCSQNAELNAFVLPPQQDKVCIGFSSSALERFDEGELRFVLGHELGHALFAHHRMSEQVLEVGDEALSVHHRMRFYAWKRYAELTADRVGMLCCQDFSAAVCTFFKLTSGLSNARWKSNAVQEAMTHAAKDAAEIEAAANPDDWFSTHPYSPLRVKALDLFFRSRTYHRLLGREGGELSEGKLEREVATIVSLMNPSELDEGASCGKETREFLVLGGIAVAAVDGRFKKSERSAIEALAGKGKLRDSIDELRKLSVEDVQLRLKQAAHALEVKLSPVRRRKVLEDLCTVALADKKLDERELDVLRWCAGCLSLDTDDVDFALRSLTSALD